MLGNKTGGSGDLYTHFVERLNYIGSQLLTIRPKSRGKNGKKILGLTFPNPDISQICQVLKVSEDEFKEKYAGQTVVWYDLEGKPHVRIDFILYEEDDADG